MVRVDDAAAAIAAPREVGNNMRIFGARFFGTFWKRTQDTRRKKCDRFVLMDQTERFETGPTRGSEGVAAMVMGATTHGRTIVAQLFFTKF